MFDLPIFQQYALKDALMEVVQHQTLASVMPDGPVKTVRQVINKPFSLTFPDILNDQHETDKILALDVYECLQWLPLSGLL